ncbi:MAG: cysteine desulfurase [Rhodobacteraceae bacterium]|nr:cysteine desulfurase [Paracoccaceae bacterium]
MSRAYLDWNATAPLRPEARAAMLAAMDVSGNPSSVHGEGRAARAIIERARAQVAQAFGASAGDIVFTSGATEAAALAMRGRALAVAEIEHDCVLAWGDPVLSCDGNGLVGVPDPAISALQLANSETGILQTLPEGLAVSDFVQGFGKVALAFDWTGVDMGILSAHKIGGPKGVGALVLRPGIDLAADIRGGGQEAGRRGGTENVIGIAGFGAAAEAAMRDLNDGLWQPVAEMRDALEDRLADEAPGVVSFGRDVARLPNTACFAVPGWKAETQVMQMDLAGFAISAGSACSSGKLRASRVLRAMGADAAIAASAIRVSLGPTTSRDDIMRFADAWLAQYQKFRARAA